jgi:hypothetical protein
MCLAKEHKVSMTLAEIHGKAPIKNSEDLLTADVFTTFKYLPPEIGIFAFLHSIDGLDELLQPLQNNETVTCAYHFWPIGLKHGREPDVLLELNVEERIYHVGVEAKYFSGPSDKETQEIEQEGDVQQVGNQLADQLRDLQYGEYRIFNRGLRNRYFSLSSKPDDRFLIYLTAHVTKPREALSRAEAQYPSAKKKLFWASWYDVYDHLASQRDDKLRFPFQDIIDDICVLLEKKSFSTFQGFTELPKFHQPEWNGSFWQDAPLFSDHFAGIHEPSFVFDKGEISGSFWQDSTN